MLVAQILNLLYNIVDRIYIARIPDVGTAALGAVGLCFPLIVVIITAFSQPVRKRRCAALFHLARGQKNNERRQNRSWIPLFPWFASAALHSHGHRSSLCPTPAGAFRRFQRTALVYACPYLMIYLIGTLPSMIAVGMNPFINAQGYSTGRNALRSHRSRGTICCWIRCLSSVLGFGRPGGSHRDGALPDVFPPCLSCFSLRESQS